MLMNLKNSSIHLMIRISVLNEVMLKVKDYKQNNLAIFDFLSDFIFR